MPMASRYHITTAYPTSRRVANELGLSRSSRLRIDSQVGRLIGGLRVGGRIRKAATKAKRKT